MALKFKNKKLQERFEKISPEFKFIMRKRFEIANQLSVLLQEKGITQRRLAELLNKSESEISKWLSGSHNLTSDTIALIEFHLGKNSVIVCAKDIKQNEYQIMTFVGSSNEIIPILVKSKGDTVNSSSTYNFSIQAGVSDIIPEYCYAVGN